MTENASGSKICVVCREDCSNKPRTKDNKGRYFCKSCFEQAMSRQQSTAKSPGATPPPVVSVPGSRPALKPIIGGKRHASGPPQEIEDRGAYGIEAVSAIPRPNAPEASAARSGQHVDHPHHTAALPTTCPSCERALESGVRVCVPCGINVINGRSIVTAEQGDTEAIYAHARGILWFASWLLWMGLIPISSEAHGARRPWALRSIALLTIFFSMWMWWYEWTGSPQMHVLKNQFLWAGNGKPDQEYIESFYKMTNYGDYAAFERKKSELADTVPGSELAATALKALPPSKRCFGEFHVWQLLTHAFLHGGFLHLGGNLLFLIIFGSRINALIGNLGTLVLYPLFAVAAALAQMASSAHEMPGPMLGASGAIMGLAGMYLVLFPVSPVHVAVFVRLPITLFLFFAKMFKCRGFWILLYFIAFDVLSTIMGWQDGTAHWAHLGGFLAGMAVAFVLLLTRAVNARGNDLLSALLGRRAWPILGKPAQWQSKPDGEGWLTRLTLVPRGALQSVLAALRQQNYSQPSTIQPNDQK